MSGSGVVAMLGSCASSWTQERYTSGMDGPKDPRSLAFCAGRPESLSHLWKESFAVVDATGFAATQTTVRAALLLACTTGRSRVGVLVEYSTVRISLSPRQGSDSHHEHKHCREVAARNA